MHSFVSHELNSLKLLKDSISDAANITSKTSVSEFLGSEFFLLTAQPQNFLAFLRQFDEMTN